MLVAEGTEQVAPVGRAPPDRPVSGQRRPVAHPARGAIERDAGSGRLQVASLDHSLWFHKASDFSQWHLYVQDSPSASGGRGFNRGSIYGPDGALVASATQEALIRYR